MALAKPPQLPAGTTEVRFRRAGGADSPDGIYLKSSTDDATICSSSDGDNRNSMFEATCSSGVAAAVGTSVYIELKNEQTGSWAKVAFGNIRLATASGEVSLSACVVR